LTNATGVVTDAYDYDAFGKKVNLTGTTPNEFLYRGEQYDPDLGLYYLRARYYNPATGRFLNRDPEDGNPVDPKTLHKYLYADGDPVNGLDPTGRADTDVAKPYSPGALEYGLVITYISLQAVRSLPQVTQGVNCILDTAGSLLKGVATDLGKPVESITFGFCSATVKKKDNCSEEEIKTCQKLYEYCSGSQCGSCLSYCTVQCEWPFHRAACNKFNFPKDWKDFPPSKWIN
jgi:RHS repeat-associated protein